MSAAERWPAFKSTRLGGGIAVFNNGLICREQVDQAGCINLRTLPSRQISLVHHAMFGHTGAVHGALGG
jgi:hypothetical protein